MANAPDSVVNDCNGNEQCIFDAVETGDTDIGMDTLDTVNNNNEDVMIASKSLIQTQILSVKPAQFFSR